MRLSFFFTIVSIVCHGQDDVRNRFSNSFKSFLCYCIEKQNQSEDLLEKIDKCGIEFFIQRDHLNDFRILADQKPDSLSNSKKGELVVFEMMKEWAPALIKECNILSNEIIKLKTKRMGWRGVSNENVKDEIKKARSSISKMTDSELRARLYFLLGIMHELDNNFEEAQKAYEASFENDPSLLVLLLQEQLKQAQTKK